MKRGGVFCSAVQCWAGCPPVLIKVMFCPGHLLVRTCEQLLPSAVDSMCETTSALHLCLACM